MTDIVQVLLIEDSEQDAELTRFALEDAGLVANVVRVDNAPELEKELARQPWDIALADYSLPLYSGPKALQLIKALVPDLPVLMISGTIGEEAVVDLMKQGASDCILKDRMSRLGATVERVLAQSRVEKERQKNEETIRSRDRKRSAELQLLADTALSLNSSSSLTEIATLGMQNAARVIGAWHAHIELAPSNPSQQPIVAAWEHQNHPLVLSVPPDARQRIYQNVKSQNIPLRQANQTFSRRSELEVAQNPSASPVPVFSGWIGVPLRKRSGENMGILFVSEKKSGDFTVDDEAVLQQVAQLVSVAAENVRLLEETKNLYEQSRISNKIKDEFLATLSHELRTPLTIILGHADLLDMESPGSHGFQASLDAIRRNARAQNWLITDLLDVSRIITGKLALEITQTNLGELMSNAVQSMKFAAEAKQIELKLTIDPDVGTMSGDANRLQQVFWNLLSNAIKFTHRHGKVEASLRKMNSNLQIDIRDTGEGIEPSFLPFVFERFRQEDGSFTRRAGGLGLGLAIVRHIVELHGGTVNVESAGKGKGATFQVNFPIVEPQTSSEVQTPTGVNEVAHDPLSFQSESWKNSLRGMSILIADDHSDARTMIQKVLEMAGAILQQAPNASDALTLAKNWKFDLFIFDIGMPDEDGVSLLRKIRKLPAPLCNTPALALTAYAREEDQTLFRDAGFQMHLSKPVEPEVLIQSVLKIRNIDASARKF